MPAPKDNKYAIGNDGGRPPIFKNARDLTKKVNEYFVYIKGLEKVKRKRQIDPVTKEKAWIEERTWIRNPEPATITGLALYLGFANRQSLYDYEKQEVYSGVIARARTRVEHEYEKKLSLPNPTGPVFALKQMNWTDKHSHELTGKDGANLFVDKSDDELKDLLKKTMQLLNDNQ